MIVNHGRAKGAGAALAFILLVLASRSEASAQTGIEDATGSGAPAAWQGTLGIRTAFVKDTGLDPFSDNDVVSQFSIAISRALARQGGLGVVGGLVWDTGTTEARARSAQARLGLNRISLLAEARYSVHPRGYGFLRAAPGVLRGTASLEDASAPGPLRDSFTSFSLDASAGAAARVTSASNIVGLWAVAEGGYGWTPRRALNLAPDLPGADQEKGAAVPLDSLAARGGFFRLALAVTY
jgi:hypothetical protein